MRSSRYLAGAMRPLGHRRTLASGFFISCNFFFIDLEFTQQKMNHFKLYISVFFSTFTMLCHHHHYLILECSITPLKKNPHIH